VSGSGFSLWMPGSPSVAAGAPEADLLEQYAGGRTWTSQGAAATYVFSYADLKPGTDRDPSLLQSLMMADVDAESDSPDDMKSGTHPSGAASLDWFDIDDTQQRAARVWLAGDRIYRLTVTSPLERPIQAADHFFLRDFQPQEK
jgi:hypothetical protein